MFKDKLKINVMNFISRIGYVMTFMYGEGCFYFIKMMLFSLLRVIIF